MPNSDSAKGNPATKRMGNPKRKTRREQSWLRGQKRKDVRRKEQAEREAENRRKREVGEPTAAQVKTAKRLTPEEKAKRVERQRKAPVKLQSFERTEANVRRIMRDADRKRAAERASRNAA